MAKVNRIITQKINLTITLFVLENNGKREQAIKIQKVYIVIKDLLDFKSATKRIPKILQTFDLSEPEIFRLSNSASLNLMARILGYENYNTIKPVLERYKGKTQMKIIKIEEDYNINFAQVVSYGKDGKSSILITTASEAVPSVVFNFNSKESMKEMLTAINQFVENDESFLDLHSLNNKLSNTDNRANQLNTNNSST